VTPLLTNDKPEIKNTHGICFVTMKSSRDFLPSCSKDSPILPSCWLPLEWGGGEENMQICRRLTHFPAPRGSVWQPWKPEMTPELLKRSTFSTKQTQFHIQVGVICTTDLIRTAALLSALYTTPLLRITQLALCASNDLRFIWIQSSVNRRKYLQPVGVTSQAIVPSSSAGIIRLWWKPC